MTKQDRIKEAYEPWWEQIKDYLDEDGWFDLDLYYSYRSNYNTLSGLTLASYPTNKRWRRAISLDGLEDNNGWIEFSSEVKIEPTTNYWVRTSNDVIQLLHGSIINSIKTKNLIQITHIILIVEPKHPLYVEE